LVLVHLADLGLVIGLLVGEAHDGRAALALDQHLHGAVGQLQQLQDGGQHADIVDVGRGRIVVGRVLLGDQKDLLAAAHHLFEGAHGLVTPDEQRDHHMREHNDIPQGQHRKRTNLRHDAFYSWPPRCTRARPRGPPSPRRCA
jgi:hypothetical protein